MASDKTLSPYPRPKSLLGLRAVAPDHGETCAYCGTAIVPRSQAGEPGTCACGAHHGVSARERLQQQMAG